MENNNKDTPRISLKYKGLLGHLRFGWLKLRSLTKIHGFFKALSLMTSNFFSVQFLYRMEGEITDVTQSIVANNDLQFSRISTIKDLLEWDHLHELAELRGPYGLVQAQMRLADGCELFFACSDRSLVSFLWLAAPDSMEAGYKMNANERYHIDSWTFSQFRGRGFYHKLVQYLIRTLKETAPSVDIHVAHVSITNKSSISAQKKAGMRKVALEVSIIFLGFHRKFRLKTYHSAKNMA